MRWLSIALSFIVALILQTTVLPFLRIDGVIPDLLLVLVIFTAIYYGSVKGAAVGFAVGLALDLIGGRHLGLGALSGFVAGYLMGHLEAGVNKENVFVLVLLVLAGSFIANSTYLLGQAVIAPSSWSLSLFWRVLAPGCLYNTGVAVILSRPLARLFGGRPPSRVEIIPSDRVLYRS
jgi:rod shape-determining protein MreD